MSGRHRKSGLTETNGIDLKGRGLKLQKYIIIAEKPKLARNIMQGIPERFKSCDGYAESEHFVVTWALGHLFELKSVEEYLPGYNPKDKQPWKLDNLPFFPTTFEFVLKKDKGVRKQFSVIKQLLQRSDIQKVYHLGDADREGEIIVRMILAFTKNRKEVLRIWTDDQMPESLFCALKNAKPDGIYDNLANEGYARMYIDWLYGINLTRYVSIKAGKLERIGRCIIAVVKEIYNRDMEIKYFVPRRYYGIISERKIHGENLSLTSNKEFEMDDYDSAEQICNLYNKMQAVVVNKKTNRKKIKPGKPYSITKLQNVMGKKYKMTPAATLAATQSLYEAGILSYPRTNSEYYAEAEAEKIKEILEKLKEDGYKVSIESNPNVFNNNYVESHGALRITKLIDQSTLKENEIKVYDIILGHMLATFCSEDYLVDETVVSIAVGDQEEFKLTGSIIVNQGWTMYEDSGKKEKILPDLQIGEKLEVSFKAVEKETSPPKHYTIETLNNYCENPFRTELNEDNEDEDFKALVTGLAIGTGATRAGIYQNAISNGYISLKKGTYYIEENGIFIIYTLQKLKIDMGKYKTAEIGKMLKKIANGSATLSEGVKAAEEQIEEYLINSKDISIEKDIVSEKEVIGKCPKCGSVIYESKTNFYCSNKECNFALFKENKWWNLKKKKITKTVAKALLKYGIVHIKGFYSIQKDKTYDADVIMDASGEYPVFSLRFR